MKPVFTKSFEEVITALSNYVENTTNGDEFSQLDAERIERIAQTIRTKLAEAGEKHLKNLNKRQDQTT